MHITSFEISKKLAEIGFKAETELGYDRFRQIDYPISGSSTHHIRCYDLETILDALPEKILRGNQLYIEKSRIGYSEQFGQIIDFDFHFLRMADESLVDTAARLLIKLHEAGLVKFKEE